MISTRHIIVLTLCLFIPFLTFSQQNENQTKWLEVYQLEKDGLTKSALEKVNNILTVAESKSNDSEILKASLYQSKYWLLLEENARLKVLKGFRKRIEEAEFPHRNFYELITAQSLGNYFQRNWYRFSGRDNEKVDTTDFNFWNKAMFQEEIHNLYQQALADFETNDTLKFEDYSFLFRKDGIEEPQTAYVSDYILEQALKFYLYRITLEDFKNLAWLPSLEIYWDTDIFLSLRINSADSVFSMDHGFKLLQKVIARQKALGNMKRYVNWELYRLKLLQNLNYNGTASYIKALNTLASTLPDEHKVTVLFAKAEILNQQGGRYSYAAYEEVNRLAKQEAHALCEEIIKLAPDSFEAKQANALTFLIEQANLTIQQESFTLPNRHSRILVEFQNHKEIQFSIYKGNWENIQNIVDRFADDLPKQLTKLTEVKNWKVDLPATTDFQTHATEVLIDPLPHGQYLLVAFDADKKRILARGGFQVTNHSFIELPSQRGEEYLISERSSGKPIAGANVNLQSQRVDYGSPLKSQRISDSNGRISYSTDTYHYDVLATVSVDGDTTYFGNLSIHRNFNNTSAKNETHIKVDIFTDRAIYRPGQMLFYKGILSKQEGNKKSVVSGEEVLITVYDNNDDEIYEQTLKTNEFGSFSDSLRIPKSVLPGEFNIYVEEGDSPSNLYDELSNQFIEAELYFRVENYKRPKFEVKAEPITEPYVLGDSVEFVGKAVSLTGSNISNASVKYTIKRTGYRKTQATRVYGNNWVSNELDLSEGTTSTDEEGLFKITFLAAGDAKNVIDEFPVFSYELIVAVTDINGETRPLRKTVSVGYHKAKATIRSVSKLSKGEALELSVSQTNLNDQPLDLNGTLYIYKSAPQKNYIKDRIWQAPDMPLITPERFAALFPFERFSKGLEEVQKTLIFEKKLSSEVDKITIPESTQWEEGDYIIHFVTNETRAYKAVSLFSLIDQLKPRTDTEFIAVSVDKGSYEPKEKLKLKMYTSLEALSLTLMINKIGQGAKEYIFNLGKSEREIKLPISKKDIGGFTIHYLAQGEGHAKAGKVDVVVPYARETIELETTSFRNKLEPGQQETWSFKVKGEKKGNVEAELLASMYDASLDQFVSHNWDYQPFGNPATKYSYKEANLRNSFSSYSLTTSRYSYSSVLPSKSQYTFSRYGYDFDNPRAGQNTYFDRFLNPNIVHILWEKRDGIEKGYVRGVIRDNFGHVLADAQITLVGSDEKTLTNYKGEFFLKAKPKSAFLVSHTGFINQEVKVQNDNYFDLRLALFERNLFEVVVNGYNGIVTPTKRLPFSVLKEVSAEDAGSALMGKIAGVRVMPSGVPGSGRQIQIRGASSLAGNNSPIIVLDGVLIEGSISDVNLQDIVSFEVLKGESATTLYGSRAANGVIIMISKRGQQKQDALFSQVKRRTNFNETAFFFPHLRTNKNGEVSFSFTTPESLTKWKFQLLAHTKTLLSNRLVNTVQTQKQLMVVPNFPRFVRESDTLVVSVKVASLNEKAMNGVARIEWLNPENDEPLNLLVNGSRKDQQFSLSAKGNESLEWKVFVPEGTSGIKYRVLATADGFSDGEENYLPVLSNGIMVTESLPIWVNAEEEKSFDFKAISRPSDSKKNFRLTFELTNNPLWNAVQSLPYIIEFPFECSEQTFSRIFANAIGQQLVLKNPKLASLIDNWATSEKPGPLFSNENLKSIALKETPWLLEAKNDKAGLQALAKLLNKTAVDEQLNTAMNKLSQMQLSSGGFPWFSGSDYANRTITTHIVAGFGQLKNLGIKPANDQTDDMINSAFQYLDDLFIKNYKDQIRDSLNLQRKRITSNHIHYLYARSFYDSLYQSEALNLALAYFNKLGKESWLKQNLQSKAMLALSYKRMGDVVMASKIMKSVAENSTSTDSRMYWLENESSFNWYQMPIETHALLMEAFDEILPDADRKQELTKWLLENKRVKAWSNTKSTTSAIYTLLNNNLAEVNESNKLSAKIGAIQISNADSEENSLFTQKSWPADEIVSGMGKIEIKNTGKNPSWGAMHYQYFEKLDNIVQGGGSLQVTKEIFKIGKSENEEKLANDRRVFSIGDRVKVRLLLSTDRDMEFIHLKDLRAAGFEPMDVLSGYQNFGGAYAYQAIDDTSIHFFFDRLNKGKYVIEYELIVNNAGSFSTGIASVESMYATEFNARAKAIPVRLIKK